MCGMLNCFDCRPYDVFFAVALGRSVRPSQVGVRFHVIDRATGVARVWHLPEAFYSTAVVNSFERAGKYFFQGLAARPSRRPCYYPTTII